MINNRGQSCIETTICLLPAILMFLTLFYFTSLSTLRFWYEHIAYEASLCLLHINVSQKQCEERFFKQSQALLPKSISNFSQSLKGKKSKTVVEYNIIGKKTVKIVEAIHLK